MHQEHPRSTKPQREALAWIREAHILEKRFEVAATEACSFFRTKTDLKQDVVEFVELHKKHEEAIGKEKQKTGKQVRSCQHGVLEIKLLLGDIENGKLPVGNLQAVIEKLDDDLRAFKLRMREEYDHLLGEERLLSKDISLAAARFDAWEKVKDAVIVDALPVKKTKPRPQSRGRTRAQAANSSRTSELQVLVDRVNQQIEMEGGPTGGWHPKEHDKFLKLWTQVNGTADVDMDGEEKPAKINQLVTKATVSLPGRSSEEVLDHLMWYKSYLKNVEKKKRLVDQWKQEKNKREFEQAMKEVAEVELAENMLFQEMASKKIKQTKITEEERQQKRLRVQAWKQEQKRKKEEEEAIRAREDMEKKEREIQERARQRHQREQVMAFRLEKEVEKKRAEEARRLLETRPKPVPPKMGNDRVARELRKAAEKRRAVEQKAWERSGGARRDAVQYAAGNLPTGRRPSSGNLTVGRDPERLIRGTASSKQKAYTPEELDRKDEAKSKAGAHERSVAFGGRDLNVGGRAVPLWRQQL